MKKILVITLILLSILPMIAAETDCPFGEIDCSYPGNCGAYIDRNNDNICDHSQEIVEQVIDIHLITGKELKTMTVDEVANAYKINPYELAETISLYLNKKVNVDDSFQYLYSEYNLEPSTAKDITARLAATNSESYSEQLISNENINLGNSRRDYHFIPITIIVVILYLITWFLSKKRIIKLITHRRVWNLVLLISFLISALLGVLLVLRIEYGLEILSSLNQLFWHVELGIIMTIVSIFHIFWHLPYFRTYLFRR